MPRLLFVWLSASVVGLGGCAPAADSCAGSEVSWEAPFRGTCGGWRTSVSGCRTYSRTHERCDLALSCTRELPELDPDAVDAAELRELLADPDVLSAIDAAPVLYGRDDPESDARAFYFEIDGARIGVGICSGGDGCAPAGVVALVERFVALEQEALDGCMPAF
jgi:hypothetical protein